MTFSLTVTLDVTGREAVIVGGGYEAVDRARSLLSGDARVTVVTPAPDPPLEALAEEGRLTLHRRDYRRGDLAGAFIAYVTREDATPVEETWAEALEERVLISTLDDVPHCQFSTPSVVRRGDLVMTIASAGRTPALAKRLRRELEATYGPELGDLVDVVDEAKQRCLPRDVPFGEWAARWGIAVVDLDGLLTRVRDGQRDEVRDEVVATLSTPTETLLTCDGAWTCTTAQQPCLGWRAGVCAPASAPVAAGEGTPGGPPETPTTSEPGEVAS